MIAIVSHCTSKQSGKFDILVSQGIVHNIGEIVPKVQNYSLNQRQTTDKQKVLRAHESACSCAKTKKTVSSSWTAWNPFLKFNSKIFDKHRENDPQCPWDLVNFFFHRVKHDLGVSIDVISIEIPLCTDTVHTDRKRAFGSWKWQVTYNKLFFNLMT